MSSRTIKIPKTLTRAATISEEGEGEKKAKRISISSDVPYLRYDWMADKEYYEVLSHAPADIADSRIKQGLPVLFNHRRDDHLGRATQYNNDGHRIDVGTVDDLIWSEGEMAQSKKRDVENGSLVGTSVGYSILDKGTQIGTKDGIPIYKFKWEPHEFSFCTIEADITVGAGRHRSTKDAEGAEIQMQEIAIDDTKTVDGNGNTVQTKTAPEQSQSNPMKLSPLARQHFEADKDATGGTVDPIKVGSDAVAEFKARCKKIDDFTDGLKNQPEWQAAVRTIAAKHKDGEAVFGAFHEEALKAFPAQKPVDPAIGMERKDVKRFSLLAGVRSMIAKGRLEGFEKEVCDAARAQMRRELPNERTFVIPEEVTRYQRELSLRDLLNRAGNVTSFTAGGATVQTQYGTLIELLRNTTVLGQLGMTILDGLVGDFVIPQQTGGCTAYWVSETGAISDSQATFAQKAMTPRRIGASYPFTMQFLAQSSLSVDAFVRNELDIAIALKKDLAGLLGTGVAGEPLGVALTPGINQTVTYSNAATWADVVEHETGIAIDNADIGTMGFALSVATVGKWKTILKDSVAGAGYLLTENMTANGYPVKRTNQLSAANQSFFGVWSQLLHVMWAGREVTVDSITLAKSGQHQIIINELCDFLVRQPLAFNVSTDSAAQ